MLFLPKPELNKNIKIFFVLTTELTRSPTQLKTTVANGSTTLGVSSTLEVQGHDLLHPARPHALNHFFVSQSQHSMPKYGTIISRLVVYRQRFVSFL